MLSVPSKCNTGIHGLRTPNEGINQKKSEILGRCGRQNMLRPYLKIWDWDLNFGRAVKLISSLGVRSPCQHTSTHTKMNIGTLKNPIWRILALASKCPHHAQWLVQQKTHSNMRVSLHQSLAYIWIFMQSINLSWGSLVYNLLVDSLFRTRFWTPFQLSLLRISKLKYSEVTKVKRISDY